MTNNDVLRRIRYAFEFNNEKMVEIFALAENEISKLQIINWLKKDDDPQYQELPDNYLAMFLNGLINLKRGKKEGEQSAPENRLTNNIILRKLKIALNLKDEDILEILQLADFRFSKHELSALFRKPGQEQYRTCQDQILRNFLHGLQIKYRKVN